MLIIPGIVASSYPRLTTAFESIATATGTGSSGTITFSSIPSTYKHLQIRWLAKDTLAGTSQEYFNMTFNSDTGANYSVHRLQGNGTAAAATGYANRSSCWIGQYASASPASTFGVGIIDIIDYANTSKYKTTRSIGGVDSNGAGIITMNSGAWLNTAAITTITLAAASVWDSSTSFALYGIKG